MEPSRFKRIKLMDDNDFVVEVGEESVVVMDEDDYATLTSEAMVEELSPNNNNEKLLDSNISQRGWGLVGRLANHPTLLHNNNNALGGSERREKLKELLLELQCGYDDAVKKRYMDNQVRAWRLDVNLIVYDIENLIEDVELEDMALGRAEASSSAMLPLSECEKLLARQKMLDLLPHTPQVSSLEDRISEVLSRLDSLKNTMYSIDLVVVREGEGEGDHDDGDDLDPSRFSGFQWYYQLPWYLKRCITYCGFMLPGPFEKDFVVSMWLSLGFILPFGGKELEDVGSIYFDILLRGSFLCIDYDNLDYDNPTCYRVSDQVVYSLPHDIEFFRLDGFKRFVITEPEKTRHISLPGSALLEYASKSPGLLSLLLVGGSESFNISYLFLRLRYLRILDLSWSSLEVIPSFVCDLVHLRYLDISYTRITHLPSDLGSLFRLMTLRLLGCSIDKFPGNFLQLVNLRHLQFSSNVTFISMPPYIGRLTLLQTLSTYVVSKAEGCSIAELGGLDNLRGDICIDELENVESVEDAKEARLHLKERLDSLVLRWTCLPAMVANYSVIEGLQPHYNLRSLEIDQFGGSQFPAWLSDSSFINMVLITLNRCNVNELPLLGHLPSIKYLKLEGMPGIKRVQDEFWRSDTTKESFPFLQTLRFCGMVNLEEWGIIREGDFPVLQKLSISFCPKLKNIPDQLISSQLEELLIGTCPELQSLPDTRLPPTLRSLSIFGCPHLTNRYHREGVDRQKVAYIPDLSIDDDDLWKW